MLYGPGRFLAIEVKHTRQPRRSDLRGLKSFLEEYPEARALLLHLGEHPLELDGVRCMPCREFLGQLGSEGAFERMV